MRNKLTDLLFKFLHVLSPTLAERYASSFAQFAKFMLVGVSNTLINYLINVAVLLALRNAHVEWDYIAGNTIGFLLSVLWSYYWNNRFVFTDGNQNRVWWKTLLKTYLSYAFTGIILNNVLSWLWINQFGISKYVSPIINLIVCVPLNFFLNKRWAFWEKKRAPSKDCTIILGRVKARYKEKRSIAYERHHPRRRCWHAPVPTDHGDIKAAFTRL